MSGHLPAVQSESQDKKIDLDPALAKFLDIDAKDGSSRVTVNAENYSACQKALQDYTFFYSSERPLTKSWVEGVINKLGGDCPEDGDDAAKNGRISSEGAQSEVVGENTGKRIQRREKARAYLKEILTGSCISQNQSEGEAENEANGGVVFGDSSGKRDSGSSVSSSATIMSHHSKVDMVSYNFDNLFDDYNQEQQDRWQAVFLVLLGIVFSPMMLVAAPLAYIWLYSYEPSSYDGQKPSSASVRLT